MNTPSRGIICFIVPLLVLTIVLIIPAGCATIFVKTDGDDSSSGLSWALAKKTIQAGINASSADGQVRVAKGTYTERISPKIGVALYGGFAGTETSLSQRPTFPRALPDLNETIIDGSLGGAVVTCPSGAGLSTRIDGFTIRRGTTGISCVSSSPAIANCRISDNNGSGISCRNSSPGISNNVIFTNSSAKGGGIYCYSGAPSIYNNIIMGNSGGASNGYGGGICCESYSSPQIINNTIVANVAKTGGGVFSGLASPVLKNNLIAFNSSGIEVYGDGVVALGNNCVYNPDGANYTNVSPGVGDISADPVLQSAQYGRLHIQLGSPCIDKGDNSAVVAGWTDMDGGARIAGGVVDIGADESDGTAWDAAPVVVRVSPSGDDANEGSSWMLAKKTVQGAVDFCYACGGGEVWTAAGAYQERIVLKPYVYLYGGFAGTENTKEERDWTANITTLDGGGLGSVVAASRTGYKAGAVDGFTIRNGKGQYWAGGIICSVSWITIANNTITGNTSSQSGGGISSLSSAPTITNNTITSNTALDGAGVYCESSSPTILNNKITSNNTAFGGDGGGLYLLNSSGTVSGNFISGNTSYWDGGGVLSISSSPIVLNNTIANNSARKGGGILCDSSAVVSGNRITDNAASDPDAGGGGVCCYGGAPTVTGNYIAGNVCSSGGGIACLADGTVANNIITANGARVYGGGIYVSGLAVIANNTITANFAQAAAGVYCDYDPARLSNNIVAFNSSGISKSSSCTPILSNNCVYNPDGANYTGIDPGIGDISVDPMFQALECGRFHIQPGSPCINAGDDTIVSPTWRDMDNQSRTLGGRVDIGADESDGTAWDAAPVIVRVSPSGNDLNDGSTWTLAKKTVQAAVDSAASQGGEVWAAGGIYSERITLKPFVHLYGGFAGSENQRDARDWNTNVTTLDGAQGGTVVVVKGSHRASWLDGFTVTGGKTSGFGGGVLCSYSSPTITNNTVAGNSAANGGGISCAVGMPIIRRNVIKQNSATNGGGIYTWSSAEISENIVERNSATGDSGGIHCSQDYSRITGNIIRYNTKRGIWCVGSTAVISANTIDWNEGSGIGLDSCSPSILGNEIKGNHASGIYCFDAGAVVIANNVISGNSCPLGGGVLLHDSTAVIVNNTITGNLAAEGGAIYANYCGPTVLNNIIAFNSSGIQAHGGAPTLRKNCLYNPDGADYTDVSPGVGDISADPMLQSAQYGRLHIQPGSPCIDKGDNSAVAAGWTDMDGGARIAGGVVDIGADESDGTAWDAAPVVVRVSPSGNDANDGSSWILAKKTVQAAIDQASTMGGEIWVAAGTYTECLILHPYAYLYGGFAGTETAGEQRNWQANRSIIDGGGNGSVVTAKAGNRTGCVDGLTIRNGKAEYGGGINCYGAAPVIANNVLSGNTATKYGGGINIQVCHPTVANNVIEGNTAAEAGGIYITTSSSGSFFPGRVPLVTNNTIVSNRAAASSSGAAIECEAISPVIVNNIVAFNSSGIYALGAPDLHNNCFFNLSNDYTNVSPGAGDISADPRFANASAGDYHLAGTSPCINTGWNEAPGIPLLDYDGQNRMISGTVDMGADEFYGLTAIKDVKPAANGVAVKLPGAVVTAAFPGFFYVEARDRSCGIRVVKAAHTLVVGMTAFVDGTTGTDTNGEKYINAVTAVQDGTGSVQPVSVTNRTLGGGDLNYAAATGAGQQGVRDGAGLNNIGLLVRICGAFTYVDSQTFKITDGSGVSVKCVVPAGVNIKRNWSYAGVTGISSCELVNGYLERVVRVRNSSDIAVYQ